MVPHGLGKRGKATTASQPGDRHAVGGHTNGGCCGANDKPRSRHNSRIAWAKLIARVVDELPLEYPGCGGDIQLITLITDHRPIWKILTHLGELIEPLTFFPAFPAR
jgi:hypothetical protein